MYYQGITHLLTNIKVPTTIRQVIAKPSPEIIFLLKVEGSNTLFKIYVVFKASILLSEPLKIFVCQFAQGTQIFNWSFLQTEKRKVKNNSIKWIFLFHLQALIKAYNT